MAAAERNTNSGADNAEKLFLKRFLVSIAIELELKFAATVSNFAVFVFFSGILLAQTINSLFGNQSTRKRYFRRKGYRARSG